MTSLWRFDNTYARLPEYFYARVNPTPVSNPALVRVNSALASELGLDPAELSQTTYGAVFSGNLLLEGAEPIAQAYAGHQFGHFVPSLGDGRAILLGEHVTPSGQRFDIQLKGSGRTPFSRRGDGRAALGPVMREYIIGEALHRLGIAATRSLAFVTTGDLVLRDKPLPGAILTRVAASHIRIGTFEYFAAREEWEAVRTLAQYVIERHYPTLRSHPERYAELCLSFMERQAALVAQWLLVGFVHGVMNTDNVALSGESIDFGPCAFIDRYDPDAVYSSIDSDGRYSYGAQPSIIQWNLARFFEALLPVISPDSDLAVQMAQGWLARFPEIFQRHWMAGMRKKLGLCTEENEDVNLVKRLLELMHEQGLDYTNTLRALSSIEDSSGMLQVSPKLAAWMQVWKERLAPERNSILFEQALETMRANNPVYIARNHLVEEAITAGVERGDFTVMDDLLRVLATPYQEQSNTRRYQEPAPASFAGYRTFCGT